MVPKEGRKRRFTCINMITLAAQSINDTHRKCVSLDMTPLGWYIAKFVYPKV